MRVGTKSVLFGAHQFLIHPFTVFLAWCELYGGPSWQECICIFAHDIGYIGKKNMEGEFSGDYDNGVYHPLYGAEMVGDLLDDPPLFERDEHGGIARDPNGIARCIRKCGNKYTNLVLYHSRTLARFYGETPSKLCWADKLAAKFDPWWLYLPRVWLSGEFKEYRLLAQPLGEVKESTSDMEWYRWARERMIKRAYDRDASPPYEKVIHEKR